MLLKLVTLVIVFNYVACIELDEYEPTDYDWEGMYNVDGWTLFSFLNIGLFVVVLIFVAGLVVGSLMIKNRVCLILEMK